jgi:hypothetical protein
MRTIKLSIIGVLLVTAAMVCAHRLFPGFRASGQNPALSAPNEVSASDNSYVTKVGISWATVRGATLYRIFRNAANDSATATAVGATPEGVSLMRPRPQVSHFSIGCAPKTAASSALSARLTRAHAPSVTSTVRSIR